MESCDNDFNFQKKNSKNNSKNNQNNEKNQKCFDMRSNNNNNDEMPHLERDSSHSPNSNNYRSPDIWQKVTKKHSKKINNHSDGSVRSNDRNKHRQKFVDAMVIDDVDGDGDGDNTSNHSNNKEKIIKKSPKNNSFVLFCFVV